MDLQQSKRAMKKHESSDHQFLPVNINSRIYKHFKYVTKPMFTLQTIMLRILVKEVYIHFIAEENKLSPSNGVRN